jgi:anti-sigma B factor antagonist
VPKQGFDKKDSAADRRARRIAEEAAHSRACKMEVSRAPERTTLSLTGDFDASCVLRYERTLRDALEDTRCLVVDMGEVGFIDSTGLALLLRTEAASRQDGFELQILRSPAAAVRSALEASGLERVLPFVDESD